MSKISNAFNNTRYEYLKGYTFISEEGIEGFMDGIDNEGLISYVVFGEKDINRKGVLEFDTKTHMIKVDYKRNKGFIELIGDPLIKDRRKQVRVNVSDKIIAKNYREGEVLSELQLINISSIGLLCETPPVKLKLGECVKCLEAYYKVVRIDVSSIGMEFKYSHDEKEHKKMLMDIMGWVEG